MKRVISASFLFIACLSSPSDASIISYKITGTVASSTGGPDSLGLVGGTFTTIFTYDDAAAPFSTSAPRDKFSTMSHVTTWTGTTNNNGSFSLDSPDANSLIVEEIGPGKNFAKINLGFSVGNSIIDSPEDTVTGPTGLSNTLDISDFELTNDSFRYFNGDNIPVNYFITNFEGAVLPVPEPTSVLIWLLVALSSVCWFRRAI